MNATALAFPFTAASTTGGAMAYSAKRSSHVLRTTEWTRMILPEMSPALAKSAGLPLPTSIIGTCLAAARAGAQAMETQRTRNSTLGICVILGSSTVPVVLTVGAGGFEHLHAPVDGTLHGRSSGYAASDFVGEVTQVAFDWGRLQSELDDASGIVGFGGSYGGTNGSQEETGPHSSQVSHTG